MNKLQKMIDMNLLKSLDWETNLLNVSAERPSLTIYQYNSDGTYYKFEEPHKHGFNPRVTVSFKSTYQDFTIYLNFMFWFDSSSSNRDMLHYKECLVYHPFIGDQIEIDIFIGDDFLYEIMEKLDLKYKKYKKDKVLSILNEK